MKMETNILRINVSPTSKVEVLEAEFVKRNLRIVQVFMIANRLVYNQEKNEVLRMRVRVE